MKRRTLDLLLSWTGLVVAVVLVTLGGLLMWGQHLRERPGPRPARPAEDLLPARGQ